MFPTTVLATGLLYGTNPDEYTFRKRSRMMGSIEMPGIYLYRSSCTADYTRGTPGILSAGSKGNPGFLETERAFDLFSI
ncbi:MAG: hypothetical protein HFI31_09515 [Lachnospiraceae bacterium]|jgi:hypothetical protein|nr:hypothetical protein [Lachnospiraceae bacterium]MCI8994980.1 hypothetical protein [Lachnospiraceae bacterium]MCI9134409.1 hypothetical protein [Lachnospiraceae bacterium]